MRLTKENVCLRNTKKARKVLKEFEYQPWSHKTHNAIEYPYITIYGDMYTGRSSDVGKTSIRPKILRMILEGSDIRYLNGGIVVAEWHQLNAENSADKLRVPLLTSEDGFELFEGDEFCGVSLRNGIWELDTFKGGMFTLAYIESTPSRVFPYTENPKHNKIFKHKENALKWIEDKNAKPKEIIVIFDGTTRFIVKKEAVTAMLTDVTGLRLTFEELEELYTTQKQLQDEK